jgi:tRNA U34 2-thiouridine synthase MnmA/TrmU
VSRSHASLVHFTVGQRRGQTAILYDGDRLLGGGWIEETAAAEF